MKSKKSTRGKMNYTNHVIRTILLNLGFYGLYSFPHTKFIKDYELHSCSFDAFGWNGREPNIHFFQFKTGKKPSKKILHDFKQLEMEKNIKCVWIDRVKRKGVYWYDSTTGLKEPFKLK